MSINNSQFIGLKFATLSITLLAAALPTAFCQRLVADLGEPTSKLLIDALDSEPPVSIRFNPLKFQKSLLETIGLPLQAPISWCNEAYYLAQRPIFTLDPLFHAGVYYPQEASSMLTGYAFQQVLNTGVVNRENLRVLDLCAAPGGKTTHIYSQLPNNALLIANEVIQSRATILNENCTRWGATRLVITNNDLETLVTLLPAFDVVVVDAPCSGEGMFRKQHEAREEWKPDLPAFCAARQNRILTAATKLTKPGGFLFYSTCTFAPVENQKQIQALCKTGEWQVIPLVLDENWGFQQMDCGGGWGYAAYPHTVKGEGFFIAVLQKKGELERNFTQTYKSHYDREIPKAARDASQYITNPEDTDNSYYVLRENRLYNMPLEAIELQHKKGLRVVKAGLWVAEQKGKDYNPTHELALSPLVNDKVQRIELELDNALKFLRCETPALSYTEVQHFALVTYKGVALGWVKRAGNRLNNYFPREWRIRMQV